MTAGTSRDSKSEERFHTVTDGRYRNRPKIAAVETASVERRCHPDRPRCDLVAPEWSVLQLPTFSISRQRRRILNPGAVDRKPSRRGSNFVACRCHYWLQ